MEYSEIILILVLVIAGIASGWLNVMAGGGSLLTIPVMLFMGIPAPVVNGTIRIGIICQNVAAVYGFFRKGFSSFKLSLSLSACASLGAIFGATMGTKLDGKLFNYFIVGVMLAVMIMTACGNKNISNTKGEVKNLLLGHLLMIGAGVWGGLIQVGVGFILMPILNRVMGLDLIRTNMHKVFIALCYSIFALAIFITQVGVLWKAGVALAIGTTVGGYLGSHTSIVKGEKWIRSVLYITLIIFMIKLLFFTTYAGDNI